MRVTCPNAARCAREGRYADEAESVLTAMPPPSQRYHTVQALSHLRSDGIPLKTPLRLRNYPSTAAAGSAFQYNTPASGS